MPDEHAEPDETAIPLRSKAIMAVSAFTPGTANKVVLGRRGTLAPKITACGVARLEALLPAGRAAPPFAPMSVCFAAMAAAPNPAMAATFSVPARWPRSCPPPFDQRLGDMNIAAANERARALRTAKLVRRDAHEVRAERVDIAIDAAGALHGVHVQYTDRRVHDLGDLSDRLYDAGFVVGEHHRHQRPRGSVTASGEAQ